ncbi:MAG: class I SAM-dependent methyltransferase [Gemmatimonas sp.]
MDAQVGPYSQLRDRYEDALELLDDVLAMFSAQPVEPAMSRLVSGLCEVKSKLDPADWRAFRSDWMHHPLARIVHQDPLTSWAYRKPWGYPGDARLLDFIYREPCIAADLSAASELGRAIYAFTSDLAAMRAIRERRGYVTRFVDQIAHERGRPISVLALAAGQLREAEQSRALAAGEIARWVALDQDAEMLAHIADAFPGSAVRPVGGSVRGMIAGRYELGTFDVIYAAGLYDHLSESLARRLTEVAFGMLNPGGELLVTNFARGIRDAGYIESFMDWRLLLRDESEMEEVWSGLPEPTVAARRLFADPQRNILYGLVQRS